MFSHFRRKLWCSLQTVFHLAVFIGRSSFATLEHNLHSDRRHWGRGEPDLEPLNSFNNFIVSCLRHVGTQWKTARSCWDRRFSTNTRQFHHHGDFSWSVPTRDDPDLGSMMDSWTKSHKSTLISTSFWICLPLHLSSAPLVPWFSKLETKNEILTLKIHKLIFKNGQKQIGFAKEDKLQMFDLYFVTQAW